MATTNEALVVGEGLFSPHNVAIITDLNPEKRPEVIKTLSNITETLNIQVYNICQHDKLLNQLSIEEASL
jgi:hypothetical protein